MRQDGSEASGRGASGALDEALDDLERMLDPEAGGEPTTAVARDPEPQPPREPTRPAHDDAQYTIPLLDDVVVPGDPVEPIAAGEPIGTAEPAAALEPIASPYPEPMPASLGEAMNQELINALEARVAERLASEIEVLMSDRLEAAIEAATEDIRRAVRNHIEIILPELVEELRRD